MALTLHIHSRFARKTKRVRKRTKIEGLREDLRDNMSKSEARFSEREPICGQLYGKQYRFIWENPKRLNGTLCYGESRNFFKS